MSFSITCADSGANCPGAFTTETKDELMQHLQMHATTAHPDMQMNAETMGVIDGLIKTG
jgi:predicted small metal-binding protein